MSAHSPATCPALSFGVLSFGTDELALPHRCLLGAPSSLAIGPKQQLEQDGDWQLWRNHQDQLSALARRIRIDDYTQLPEQAERCYRELFEATTGSGRALARIWNFVPAIHADQAGLENYRLFNLGRSRAFAAAFGETSSARMPAATGIGSPGAELILIALLDEPQLRHLENPRQLPAWKYPPEYGPASPSFARATISADGHTTWLAGTAAVIGHQSQGDSLADQLKHTWDNIRALEAEFPGGSKPLDFTAWVRHPDDAEAVAASLCTQLPASTRWRVVEAEICRRELLVEIEGIYQNS